MLRTRSPKTPQLSEGGHFFCRLLQDRTRLRFPQQVARRLWDMIDASDDPEAQAFQYQTSLLLQRLRGKDKAAAVAMIRVYFGEWLTPGLITDAVSELEAREEISPTTSAHLRAQVGHWTTPDGGWRWEEAEE